MAQSQESLNVNVNFEGELAQYLADMAAMQNRTIEEIVKDLVEEDLEASKLDDDKMDEADISLLELAAKRNVPGAKIIRHEDIKWE